ncbi:hypothetical protein ACFL6D_03970 [Spirochaetota bacterium]
MAKKKKTAPKKKAKAAKNAVPTKKPSHLGKSARHMLKAFLKAVTGACKKCAHLILHIPKKIKAYFTKNRVIFLTDVGLIFSFIFIILTGLFKLPWLQMNFMGFYKYMPMYEISWVHDISGILTVILTIMHKVLHWSRFWYMVEHKRK